MNARVPPYPYTGTAVKIRPRTGTTVQIRPYFSASDLHMDTEGPYTADTPYTEVPGSSATNEVSVNFFETNVAHLHLYVILRARDSVWGVLSGDDHRDC